MSILPKPRIVCSCVWLVLSATARAEQRPNVVILLADDLGYKLERLVKGMPVVWEERGEELGFPSLRACHLIRGRGGADIPWPR